MLRKESVEKGTMDLVEKLMADEKLASFNFVGGTALALKIGHRKSIDIDLFAQSDFDSQVISQHLTATYNTTRLQRITNGVFCLVDGIKLDLLAHKYPLVEDVELIEGVRMVSLKDIGAMKLNAIYGNGTRLKDFVDMHALLQEFSLQELLQASEVKYPENNIGMVKHALLHHDDIDFSVPIDFIGKEIKWPSISERLHQAIQNPQQIFQKIPPLKQNPLEKKQGRRKKPKGPRL